MKAFGYWKSMATGAAAVALISLGGYAARETDSGKPKDSISDIMKKAHKGDDSLSKKVSSGKASKDEIGQLLAYYKEMNAQDPPKDAPKGSPADWKKRTEALVTSVEKIQTNEPSGQAAYKTAVNCRACHTLYRKPQ